MVQPQRQPEYVHGRLPGDVFIRLRRRTLHRLRRSLGVGALFSSAYGNVGSSIYYALGVTALYALGLTPVVFMLAGIIFACTALTYAEGTAAIPEAGGSSSFARRAFNDLVSFVAGWVLMLDYIITIAISAFAVPNYLGVFVPELRTWPYNSLVGIALIGVLAGINVWGVGESSLVNVTLAVLDLVTQALLAGLGMVLLFSLPTLLGNIHLGEAPTWGQLIYGISISMIAYTGIETISNLAEESRSPGRNVPRAVLMVVVAVLGLYGLISVIALSAMPVVQQPDGTWTTELATTYLTDPVVGIVRHMPEPFQSILGPWVGMLAATILIVATNAGLLGLSRLAYSMGQHRQLVPFLSRLHPTRRTPYVAILLFSAVAALLVAPGSLEVLADLYSFGAMLAFTLAHVSVIALRWKFPRLERPFQMPLNVRVRGRQVPVPAVVGGTATFATWLIVVASHPFGRAVGIAWLLVGLAAYWLYRRSMGLSVFQTVHPPIEYRQIFPRV